MGPAGTWVAWTLSFPRGTRVSSSRSPERVGVVLGALLTPQFVALGAPTVALPDVASGLHVPFGQTAWVLTAWALMSAVAMPVFGTLTRRLGLRTCVLVGSMLVAVGSLTAALGPTLLVMIVGRAVGGTGAGALVVTVYAAVAAQLDGSDRSRALGIVAAAGAGASGCGALIGGAVTAVAGWRVVVALPVAALLVCPFAAALASTDRDRSKRIDMTGAVLLTAVGAAVVLLLQAASTHLGIPVIAALVVVGATAAVLLIHRVGVVPDGFVPRRVVTAPGFLSAGATGLTVFAAYYAALFAVPTLVHTATGWGPVSVGAAVLPAAAFSIAGGRAAPTLARRSSVPTVAIAIAVSSTVGVLLAAVSGSTVPQILGLALTAGAFAAGQATLIGFVPQLVSANDADTAQGLFDFVVYGGSSVGPAVVGGLSASTGLSHALLIAAALPCVGVGAALWSRTRTWNRPSPEQTAIRAAATS